MAKVLGWQLSSEMPLSSSCLFWQTSAVEPIWDQKLSLISTRYQTMPSRWGCIFGRQRPVSRSGVWLLIGYGKFRCDVFSLKNGLVEKMCSAVHKRARAGWVGWSFIHQWNYQWNKNEKFLLYPVYTGPEKCFNEWFRLFPCNPFTLWNRANSVSNFSMICRSKTCTVRKFRVNEMRLCASFCPFICPDVFNLNVVLSFFKLSPTLLGIVSKIVAIQHTHRRCLFLSSQYSTLS